MPFSVGFRGLGRWGRSNPNGIGSDSSPMFAGLSPAPGLLQRPMRNRPILCFPGIGPLTAPSEPRASSAGQVQANLDGPKGGMHHQDGPKPY